MRIFFVIFFIFTYVIMIFENVNLFLTRRNIIDLERHPPYDKFLGQLCIWDRKLLDVFEDRMKKDNDFKNHVVSKIMAEKDIKILEAFPDDPGTYQGGIGGDMEKRYNAIVRIMEGYLGKKYASERT